MTSPAAKPYIPGKWYACDTFSDLKIGPFDTKREAEKECRASNICGDMVAVKCPIRKYTPCAVTCTIASHRHAPPVREMSESELADVGCLIGTPKG